MDSGGVLGRCPDNLLLLADDRQRAVRLARKPTAISHHPRHAGPPSGQAHPPPWTVCGQLRMTVRCPTSSASQKDRVESPPVPCASRTVRRHPLCHACDRPVGTSFDVRTYLPAQESVVPLRADGGRRAAASSGPLMLRGVGSRPGARYELETAFSRKSGGPM